MDPTARVVRPDEMPVRQEGDVAIRVLVGEGSPVELGTPASILDVILERGGTTSHDVPAEFQGLAYLLIAGKPYGEMPRFGGPFVD